MRSIALVARTVMERHKTDIRINYGKVILLTIPTLGIYNIVTFYRLMKRIHMHYNRQHLLYKDITSFLSEYSNNKGIEIEGLSQLKYEISDIEYDEEGISFGLWFFISLLTLGIGGIYPLYRLTTDPHKHDKLENRVLGRINNILLDLKLIDKPIVKQAGCKKRIFFLYILFTILTAGCFSIYWSYVITSDFNKHFKEHDEWEINLLNNLSKF